MFAFISLAIDAPLITVLATPARTGAGHIRSRIDIEHAFRGDMRRSLPVMDFSLTDTFRSF